MGRKFAPQNKEDALAELMQLLQGKKDKVIQKFMSNTVATLKATIEALQALSMQVANGSSNGSNNNNNSQGGSTLKPCPHRKCIHPKVALKDCWMLDKNASKHPQLWTCLQEKKEKSENET